LRRHGRSKNGKTAFPGTAGKANALKKRREKGDTPRLNDCAIRRWEKKPRSRAVGSLIISSCASESSLTERINCLLLIG
jgi:hypothetical protein